MDKVGNAYSYQEGVLSFLYYPDSGMVKGATNYATLRAIEHFAYRGFEVDWVNINTNIGRNTFYIKPPEHLTEEDIRDLIRSTKKELTSVASQIKAKEKERVLGNNWNNKLDRQITETYLYTSIANLKKKDRKTISEWFNKFNIEEVRRCDSPLLTVSSRSVTMLIEEGKNLVFKLYHKGKLIRYSEEEYQNKLRKYGVNSEE